MEKTDKILLSETNKWLERLKKEIVNIKIRDPKIREHNDLMVNINAYIKDTYHFLDKKDYVRAFEAVVYAWGLFEAGKRLGVFE